MIRRRFGDLALLVPPGVYAPRRDTAMLAAELGPVGGLAVLELCAGTGALALMAARRGAGRVVAVDHSARAVHAARVNARLNGLRVDIRRGDLMDALDASERFDLILANPPYLPVMGGHRRIDARWDAGPAGRALLDRIVSEAPGRLRPGGRVVIVQSDLAGTDETCAALARKGLHVERRREHRGPLGPIADARRTELVQRGLLGPGDDEELIVVILAGRPAAASVVAA